MIVKNKKNSYDSSYACTETVEFIEFNTHNRQTEHYTRPYVRMCDMQQYYSTPTSILVGKVKATEPNSNHKWNRPTELPAARHPAKRNRKKRTR